MVKESRNNYAKKSSESKKIAVYTCIAGNYDSLKSIKNTNGDVDFICFTDCQINNANGWIIKPIPKNYKSNFLSNRYVKMHSHIILSEYEICIYIDGSIEVVGNIYQFACSAVKDKPVAMYQHPFRNCIYEEAEVCKNFGFDWHWRINKCIKKCREQNYPRNNGLYECGVIVIQNKNPKIVELMESWWDEIELGVASRMIVWTLDEQMRMGSVPVLQGSDGGFALEC